MIYSTIYHSPVGKLTIASDEKHIIGVWMEGQKYFGGTLSEEMHQKDELPVFEQAKNWFERYFKGKKPLPWELPLKPAGSEFRQLVWKELCKIPYGEVTTYGEIAKKVAKAQQRETMSPQAIGGAVGHNPISIIIPCHRVVGTNKSLTGYAGGIDVKKALLKLEQVDLSNFFEPKKDHP